MAISSSTHTARINQVDEHLYSGLSVSEGGHPLYFGFEEVDEGNIDFWRYYEAQARSIADLCSGFCLSVTVDTYPAYPNEFSEGLSYDEGPYHEIAQFIQKKGWFQVKGSSEQNPFTGVKGGCNGMQRVLFPSKTDEKVFMVYLSTAPVEKRHVLKATISNGADYRALFGEIVMSFVFITGEDVPTVSHYGIFKNPSSFFDLSEKYKNLSMKLHGFAAAVASGKKYMITSPMPSMAKIMCKELGRGRIHIGTNLDLKSLDNQNAINKELLQNYPPRLHCDSETGVWKIAKEAVDLSNYLDSLPDEQADAIFERGKKFNFSGHTMGALRTLVPLEHLARFY